MSVIADVIISFKGVSKTFLKYFVKFQKTKYDELRSFVVNKIVVL